MWNVLFTSKAEQEIRRLVQSGKFSEDDRRVLASWIRQVKNFGPESLRNQSIWYDHALSGKLTGYRASAFSYSGRIIYKIEDKKITVIVVRVTPDHDYKE